MKISGVVNKVVDYGVKKPLDALSKTKVVDKVCKSYVDDNTKFIAGVGLSSILLKDGLGCYMYVKQSLNNEKIPEEKRKFMASLDLANGGLMILSQLGTFFTLSNKKVQGKIFGKLFGKNFTRAAKKGYLAILKKNDLFKKITGKEFNMAFDSFKSKAQGTFGVVSTLIASSILAKRVIVPFIATPLAEKAKGLLYKEEELKLQTT